MNAKFANKKQEMDVGIKKISLASLGPKKCGCWIESRVPVCNPFTEESGRVMPLCETSLTEQCPPPL